MTKRATKDNDSIQEHESASQNLSKHRKIQKSTALVVLSLVFLATVTIVGIYISRNDQPQSEQDTVVNRESITEKATRLEEEGDTEAALLAIDEHIDSLDNDSEKASYLQAQALIALRNDLIDESMAYAVALNDIEPTFNSLALLATLSERKGNKESALDYYQQALNKIEEDDNFEAEEAGYIEQQIDRLKEEAEG